jgi:AcrR family transcriptional regulator
MSPEEISERRHPLSYRTTSEPALASAGRSTIFLVHVGVNGAVPARIAPVHHSTARPPIPRRSATRLSDVDDSSRLITRSPRKERVLEGATDIFHQVGFHKASMSAIAAAADITGGAIYRHYANKQGLLAAVIERAANLVDDAFNEVETAGGQAETVLDNAGRALARMAVEHRRYGAIIQRDTRCLPAGDRERLQTRWHATVGQLARLVAAAHPEHAPHNTELIARAAFAVAASPSYARATRPFSAQHRELVDAMIAVVLTGGSLAHTECVQPPPRLVTSLRNRASRRQVIMAVATRLFAERGFNNVSMEHIAKVACVTVPTIYSYFEDKATLLTTSQGQGHAWLQLSISRAIEHYIDPHDQFAAALGAYAQFGVEHPDHMAIIVHEIQNLPDEYLPVARLHQQEYVAEIVRLLRAGRPELDEPSGRVLIHGALGVINELTRTPRYLGRPNLTAELSSMTLEISAGGVCQELV